MALSKDFLALVSKDAAVKAELDKATGAALNELLKAKGLEDEVKKATEAAAMKVAEAHGFKAEAMESMDEDEMKAVAGGTCTCAVSGDGNLMGDFCGCTWTGTGDHYPHGHCDCWGGGYGGGESN